MEPLWASLGNPALNRERDTLIVFADTLRRIERTHPQPVADSEISDVFEQRFFAGSAGGGARAADASKRRGGKGASSAQPQPHAKPKSKRKAELAVGDTNGCPLCLRPLAFDGPACEGVAWGQLVGPLANGRKAHLACALWAPRVQCENVDALSAGELKMVDTEIRRARQLVMPAPPIHALRRSNADRTPDAASEMLRVSPRRGRDRLLRAELPPLLPPAVLAGGRRALRRRDL
jgi:hypothetical protein